MAIVNHELDPVSLSKKLISFKTVTPNDDGIMSYLSQLLESIGFSVDLQKFTDANDKAHDTLNLYAERNFGSNTSKEKQNLCFAGHVDVVPPGKEYLWTYPPFEPTLDNGQLFGRGASDMKCAIASFISAASEYFRSKDFEQLERNASGKISLLITGDEEDNAINGTRKMLEYIHANGTTIDDCIVGEPTSAEKFGDCIKIGRRGSVTFTLEVHGVQGHVAYPHLAKNPITLMARTITALKEYIFDNGSDDFQPTNLEVVSLNTENRATNVIPQACTCVFNVRFTNQHTSQVIEAKIRDLLNAVIGTSYKLSSSVTGEAFLSGRARLADIIHDSVLEVTGVAAEYSTTGGTSDARFIKNYARVVEFGLLNTTAHKVDENVSIEDIYSLSKVYLKTIAGYFSK